MSIATIKTDIQTRLETVTNIGNIFKYHPRITDSAKIQREYYKNNRLNAWFIARTSIDEIGQQLTNVYEKRHIFTVAGIYQFIDNSEESYTTFDALVDSVVEAFLAPGTWSTSSITDWGPATAPIITMQTFAQILCHYCEINIPIIERVST